MEMTLQMSFITDLGKTTTISLADPREDLEAEEVQEAMESLISAHVFAPAGGALAAVKTARLVGKQVTELF